MKYLVCILVLLSYSGIVKSDDLVSLKQCEQTEIQRTSGPQNTAILAPIKYPGATAIKDINLRCRAKIAAEKIVQKAGPCDGEDQCGFLDLPLPVSDSSAPASGTTTNPAPVPALPSNSKGY